MGSGRKTIRAKLDGRPGRFALAFRSATSCAHCATMSMPAAKHILRPVPCGFDPRTPFQPSTSKVLFRSFHEGVYLMTNETPTPGAPATPRVNPAVTPTPQQNQGDAKPSAD